MNVVLLITVLALVVGGNATAYYPSPSVYSDDPDAYSEFVLQGKCDTTSCPKWRMVCVRDICTVVRTPPTYLFRQRRRSTCVKFGNMEDMLSQPIPSYVLKNTDPFGEDTTCNPFPCMRNPNKNAYNQFVSKHVLQMEFDTSSPSAWKQYLQMYNLCNRTLQSFVNEGAENFFVNICNGSGKRQRINLCTSTKRVWLYDLNVNTSDCSVTYLDSGDRYVTVACDKVNNRCLPVHFENSQNYGPDKKAQTCKP